MRKNRTNSQKKTDWDFLATKLFFSICLQNYFQKICVSSRYKNILEISVLGECKKFFRNLFFGKYKNNLSAECARILAFERIKKIVFFIEWPRSNHG